MPKRFPYASVILGLILALVSSNVVSNVVKFFQAKTLADSGLALETQNIISDSNREKAIAKYREAIQIAPNFAPAHYYLANALRTKGLKEEAIAEYREAIRSQPNAAQAYQGLGEMLEAQGKLQEAFNTYFQAIRKQPKFVDPRVKLGLLLEKQGRLDEAIAQYEEALRLYPAHPNSSYEHEQIYYILGQAFKKRGDLAAAIQSYVTAIRTAPNCLNNYFCTFSYGELIPILKQQSKSVKPISEYIKALILHPQAEKYIEIAAKYEKQGKQAPAYYYIQAINFDPKKAQSYVDLGTILDQQYTSSKQEIIAAYKQAIHLDPNNEEAYQQLGSILERQGKLDQAIANYREVIRLDPNSGFAQESIGNILYQQGKYQEAIPYLKAAINKYKRVNSQNTFSERIKEIQEKLQKEQ